MVRFQLSAHARERMEERGLSLDAVASALATARAITYWHNESWKTGFYDRRRRLFIAVVDDTIITVMTNISPGYVRDLRRLRP